MSAQHYAATQGTVDANGIRHTTLANGDTVQEAASGRVFLGLRAAGGEAFAESDSDEYEEEYHHPHHQQTGYPRAHSSSPPQYTGQMVMPVPVKVKKSKKSKKERSGSSSSGQQHTCNCGHNHH